MTDDVATLLREAASRVPDHPGDLAKVHHRARQRTRRGRTAVAAGVAVVALLVLAALKVPMARPPVIDGGEAVRLDLPLCAPQWCPDGAPDIEEVVAAVRDDPAVQQVRTVDAATRARRAAEAAGQPLEEFPAGAIGGLLEVTVVPGEDGLAAVARRLHELTGAGVRRPTARHVLGHDTFDPQAHVGPVAEVASVDVGGRSVTLRMWAVEGGGRCLGVGELVSCGADELLARGTAGTGPAWGHPVEDLTCVWAPVGYEVDALNAEFADGGTVDGSMGNPPRNLLAGAGLACTAGRTHPVALATERTGGAGSQSGFAPYAEVRPPSHLGWDELVDALFDRFPDGRVAQLATRDVPARQDAIAGTLARAPLPAGVASIGVIGRDHGIYQPGDEDPSTQVAVVVTPDRGDPICVVAMLYPASGERTQPVLMMDRPAIWTPEEGCPDL